MKDPKYYTKMMKKDYNFFKKCFYFFAKNIILKPYFHFFWKMKVYGIENIEDGKKYIISPNHISFLDPLIVASICKKNISYMSKKELFENKILATVVRQLGAFSVNREKIEFATVRTVKEVFKTDWWLGIFPQGGIFRYEPISHVHTGFASIAKMAKTDILPIGISGTEKFDKKHLSGKLIVKIGKPISYLLSQEEIMKEWAIQVGELSGYGTGPLDSLKEDKVVDNV